MTTAKTFTRTCTRSELGDLEVLLRSRIEFCDETAVNAVIAYDDHDQAKEYRKEARRLRKLYSYVVLGVR